MVLRQICPRLAAIAALLCAAPNAASIESACGSGDEGDAACTGSILEEIVVTATRTRGTLLRSPLSMSLIGAEELRRSTADGIADILRDLPGVSVTDSGQAGMRRVRFRGEESRRVAVLIDGQELTDHREVGVPLLIDPALVERIEVVRGPASVLYGAKALGGVINVITRKGGSRLLEGTFSTTYNSASDGLHASGSLFGARGDLSYRLQLAANEQKERQTPAGEIENTRYRSDALSLYLARSSRGHHIALGHERHRADSEVYVEPAVRFTFPFLDFAIDVPQRDRRKTSLFYEMTRARGALEKIEFNAYRQFGDRRFNTSSEMLLPFPPPGIHIDSDIDTTSQLTTDGALVQLDWRASPSHYLIGGVQYSRDQVQQRRLRESSVNFAPRTVERIRDRAGITTFALYVQDEWSLASGWTAVAGLRNYRVEGSLDETSRPLLRPDDRSDAHLVGSLSLLYALRPDTTLRLTMAEGYVYPSLLQLATGAYAGSRFINPQLDLRPETSDSLEFGMRHSSERWRIDGVLFTNRAENYIDHLLCTAEDDCLTPADEVYRNIGSSRSYGIEVESAFTSAERALEPYLNLSWYRRRNEHEGTHTYKSGIPKLSGRTGVRHTATLFGAPATTDLFLRYESSSEELDITATNPAAERNARWVTLNADFAIDPPGPLRIDVALRNLTDRKYTTATENLYAEERAAQVKLALAL